MSDRYVTLSTSGLCLFMDALEEGSIVANVCDCFGSNLDIMEFNKVFKECSDILYGSCKGQYVFSDDRVVNAISDAWRIIGEADDLADRVNVEYLFEIESYIDDAVRGKNDNLRYCLYDFDDGYMTFVYQRSQLLRDAYQLSVMAEKLEDLGKSHITITIWVD